jgi:hypothetical protein
VDDPEGRFAHQTFPLHFSNTARTIPIFQGSPRLVRNPAMFTRRTTSFQDKFCLWRSSTMSRAALSSRRSSTRRPTTSRFPNGTLCGNRKLSTFVPRPCSFRIPIRCSLASIAALDRPTCSAIWDAVKPFSRYRLRIRAAETALGIEMKLIKSDIWYGFVQCRVCSTSFRAAEALHQLMLSTARKLEHESMA